MLLRRILLLTLTFLLLGLAMISAKPAVDLPEGPGSYEYYDSYYDFTMTIYYYRPSNLTKSTPVVMVMHGAGRTAMATRIDWSAVAEENGLCIIAPHLSKDLLPGSDYILGNIMSLPESEYPEDISSMARNTKELWVFSLIDRIFDDFKTRQTLKARKYYLYGHSGGSQFVHRMMLLYPEGKVERAYAANAGWYTKPLFDIDWPYGIGGMEDIIDSKQVDAYLETPLTILLGDQDLLDTSSFRKTEETMLQGGTRFARGLDYYETGRTLAAETGAAFSWEKIIVEGVGHSNREMSLPAAAALIDFLNSK